MDLIQIKAQWEKEGYYIFPNFINSAQLNRLRFICDHILEQWFKTCPNYEQAVNASNMAFLTESHYFKSHPNWLIELLEFIAKPQILEILRFLAGQEILFHNTQYFYNPASHSWKGIWHRDTQFMAPDPTLEKERMKSSVGVHFRVAFLPDDYLEYVPGSEKRWDTAEEYAIRKAENGNSPNATDMPGKKKIILNPGDGLLFHAWGIHRGVYDVDKLRRTLDIIYQWGNHCDYCPPPATCFNQLNLLNQLTPVAQEFFDYFIKTYKNYWS